MSKTFVNTDLGLSQFTEQQFRKIKPSEEYKIKNYST